MAKATLGALLGRVLRLRCPRCGMGKLFRTGLGMYEKCPECRFKYERSPGYFLGSTYINYGLTAVIVTFLYIVLHFGLGWTNRESSYALVPFVVLFPLICFRYARGLWLGFDCFFDSTDFDYQEHWPSASTLGEAEQTDSRDV